MLSPAMRIILDECIPTKLAASFVGHTVTTVAALGWNGIRNGELLSRLEQESFDILVTVDKNLRHQQKIEGRGFAVLVFDSPRNTLASLIPRVDLMLQELPSLLPGKVYIR